MTYGRRRRSHDYMGTKEVCKILSTESGKANLMKNEQLAEALKSAIYYIKKVEYYKKRVVELNEVVIEQASEHEAFKRRMGYGQSSGTDQAD